ncbi:MAG: type IV toxin-antitoxin system AbiEi family antitoxin domain-containing protein [Jiangellaceae bacterium]
MTGRRLFDETNSLNGVPAAGDHVFVVTHQTPTDWEYAETAPWTFVTDGVEAALHQAREYAGDRIVDVGAGQVGGQALRLGLIDQVVMHVVLVVLGAGRPFFGAMGPGDVTLSNPTRVVQGSRVTHLLYDVERPADRSPTAHPNAHPPSDQEHTSAKVPLPDAVQDAIASHMTAHPPVKVTLPWNVCDGKPTTVSLLLTSREKKALNRNYFNTFISRPALQRVEAPDERENGCHALRHFYASTALHDGETITTAQAADAGVSRKQLSRMAAAGAIERVAQGVYRMPGAPPQDHEAIYATWLALGGASAPRPDDGVSSIVAGGVTAAVVHDVGDFFLDGFDFIVPARKGTRLPGVRLRIRQLTRDEVIPVDGLPTLSVERTLADLVELGTDLSLVADAARDAIRADTLVAPDRLVSFLSPVAARRKTDGRSLANHLFELAGVSPEGWNRD